MAGTVVEKLIIEIAGDSKKFKKELDSLKKSNRDGEASFKKFATVGKAAFLAVGAAATVMAVASTKAFIEFEKGFTGVVKTTNLAGKDLEVFKHEIMSLSEEIPQTTTQLLEIATAAGQLGIKGTKSLTVFTETIAKLGATTDLEGGDAAVAIARILNLTGEGTETVDAFGSAIVDLGNNFATSESQILEVAKEVAKATVNFNLSSPQILGMSAAMSSLGIAAEAGSTVVSKAFMKIDEVIRSQAGPQFEKLIELTGMTGDELTKTFKTDAVSVFESFVIGLGEAGETGKSMAAELNELGLQGIRVEKILPSLAKRSDILSAALKRSTKAAGENTALNKEAALAFATTSSKITIAGNKVNNLAIGLGEKLAPALIKVIDALLDFSGLNKTIAEDIAESITDVDRLSASFGRLGPSVKAAVDKVQKELNTLDRNAKRSTGAQKKISDDSIKDKEKAAAKSEAIAKASAAKSEELAKENAAELERIEKEKLDFILRSNVEFVKSMDELVSIEETAAKEVARIRKASDENRAFAMRQAILAQEEIADAQKAADDKSTAAAEKIAEISKSQREFVQRQLLEAVKDLTKLGEKLDTTFGGDFADVFAAQKNISAGTAAGQVAKSVGSQVTGVGGAIQGFAAGGPAGAVAGFVTEMLLSNDEFRAEINELNAIIQEAFAPIIHELIPVMRLIGTILKEISPSIQKIAIWVEPIGKAAAYLADVIVKLSDSVKGLNNTLEIFEDSMNVIKESLDALVDPLHELSALMGELNEPLENLTGSLDHLDKPLEVLTESLDALIDPINKLADIIEDFNPLSGGSGGDNLASKFRKALPFAKGSPGLKESDLLRMPGMESGSGLIQAHEGEIVIPKDFKVDLGMRTPASNMQFQDLSKSGSGTGGEVDKKITVDIVVHPDEMTDFFSAKQREQIDLGTSKQ